MESGQELLRRLRSRDRSALEAMALIFGSALSRAAYLHLGDSHAAADAAQETLMAAWDGAQRTGSGTPLRPWLFGILFHTCRKHLRALSRRRRRERGVALRRPEASHPVDAAEGEERAAVLREALADLDEGMRAVIVLRYEEGMTVAETAAALEIPEGTVKSRAHTAVRRLREAMSRER